MRIKKKENLTDSEISQRLNQEVLADVLEKVGKEFSVNELKTILKEIATGQSLSEALSKKEVDLTSEIKRLLKNKPGLSHGAYMGLIMHKFKGHVTGKEVAEELNRLMCG